MKTFLKTLAAAALLMTGLEAKAQQYQYYHPSMVTLLSGTVTNVAANTTNTVSYVIDTKLQEYVPIFLSAKPNGTNRVWVNLVMQRSIDGTTYDTQDPWIVNITAVTNVAGGHAALITNLNVGGVGYLKITGIGNLAGFGTMTNFVIGYGIKR